MEINLNDPNDFTRENLKKLIASKDDSKNRQLRVTDKGFLYLSDVVGNKELEGVQFRLETLAANTGHVGIEASEDEFWIGKLYEVIKKNWPSVGGYQDVF